MYLALSFSVTAQSWQDAIGPTNNNFLDIKAKADAYFEQKQLTTPLNYREIPNASGERNFDKEYHKYQRWLWFWESRVYADGSFPSENHHYKEYKKYKNSNAEKNIGPQWQNITQTTSISGYDGMGRTTCMAFHPSDVNTFYVGAPNGGLWKTWDGGNNYVALGNDLPFSAVGNIVLDHQDPNTIYLGMGDNTGWWNYSLGVMKSTDGGDSWNFTDLDWTFNNGVALSKLVMDPTDNQVLLAGASNGIWRTEDGGASWSNVQSGYFSDILYHPSNPSIVYAASYDYWGTSEIFRSTDGGQSFTQTSNFGISQSDLWIAVTEADPDRLLVLFKGNNELYTSLDAGQSFSLTGTAPAHDGLIISQTNADRVWVGQLDVHRSLNGGASWNQISIWWNDGSSMAVVHADTRNVAWNPLTPNDIWFCNDGGIYKMNQNSSVFTDKSNGLVIMQYYALACSQSEPDFVIGGTQDNGGRQRISGTTWTNSNGGDAMVQAIDPTNADVFYTTYINGSLYRTTDRWTNDTYHSISDNIPGQPSGKWVTPYVIDPNSNTTLVAGYDEIYRSTNRGDSWTQLSTNLSGGDNFTAVQVAPSNSDVIIAAEGNRVFITTDLGNNWETEYPPLSGGVSIQDITIDPTDENRFWVSVDGYVSSKKVYMTEDGGQTWTNFTTGLPNVPINALMYQAGSNDVIYAGTDIGVFYRNANMTEWIWWSVGMPNTVVTDIDIQYSAGIIRVSTYGRGIFERDLCDDSLDSDNDGVTDCQDLCPEDPDKIEPGDCGCGVVDSDPCSGVGMEEVSSSDVLIYPNPTNGLVQIEFNELNAGSTVEVLNIQGQTVDAPRTNAGGRCTIDLSGEAAGIYWLRFTGAVNTVEKVVLTR